MKLGNLSVPLVNELVELNLPLGFVGDQLFEDNFGGALDLLGYLGLVGYSDLHIA